MANKNGIIINVGFDSDIKDYVNRIERQLKAVDWNGVLGLSESFNKEYEKITKQLQVLKKEISDLGAPDIHNMNNRLQSITQLTNRLTQQFDALVTSLPTDMQAKMNRSLTSVGNMLTNISEISNQAATAINDFTRAVVNSGGQVETATSRVAEIQKLIGAIGKLRENHKAFDTGEYFNDKSIGDQAKMLDRLYDIYEAYENANKRFSSNNKDLGAVKELQEQFYRFKELYDQILDLDVGDQDSSLTQFWKNVSLLGDKSGAALSDVLNAMKKNYIVIMNGLKKYRENLMAESATFKDNVATAVQTETKEIKKGSNGETIRLVIGVDDSVLNKELLDAIAKAQAFAEKNPVHVSVDISTKYRIRKDKENLALLQAEMDSIKEEIENAQYNGASDKAVAALQNKLENAAKTFDKYFKGLDTAYSFHISLHTEYAMKQLSMFISQVKEQINKLKQDKLVFAPEVEIDEAFETHLKESTEKVLGKMQDAITKTADALDRLKVYFTEGIEMKPDFMKEERVTLGLLWQDLKKVYDQVILVSEVFKSLAGEKITINNDMQTETLESLKGAMSSISDVIGEETTKKLQIELENTEELKAQLHTLKKEIDKLFETNKMNKWETQYLNAIKNIETAFEGLFGVKESNEMELVSYLAKDIAMTDKAMMDKGRFISEDDATMIYNSLALSDIIKDSNNNFKDVLDVLTKQVFYTAVEHGGYLTKDFKVGGLTSDDNSDSTGFDSENIDWEKYGAKIAEGILSYIHSHAGDEIWMPSIADLKKAAGQYTQGIPYFTTFTGKEVSVIDTKKLAEITANISDVDWDKLNKDITKKAKNIFSKRASKKDIKRFEDELYKVQSTTIPEGRTAELIASRIAFDEILKKRYGVGIDDFSKIYALDEYAKARPYGDYHKEEQFTGLSGIITTLQNVVQSATTLAQSLVNYGENQAQAKAVIDPATLTESIINALNTATVNINVDSLAEIIQNAIASSVIKVDTNDKSKDITVYRGVSDEAGSISNKGITFTSSDPNVAALYRLSQINPLIGGKYYNQGKIFEETISTDNMFSIDAMGKSFDQIQYWGDQTTEAGQKAKQTFDELIEKLREYIPLVQKAFGGELKYSNILNNLDLNNLNNFSLNEINSLLTNLDFDKDNDLRKNKVPSGLDDIATKYQELISYINENPLMGIWHIEDFVENIKKLGYSVLEVKNVIDTYDHINQDLANDYIVIDPSAIKHVKEYTGALTELTKIRSKYGDINAYSSLTKDELVANKFLINSEMGTFVPELSNYLADKYGVDNIENYIGKIYKQDTDKNWLNQIAEEVVKYRETAKQEFQRALNKPISESNVGTTNNNVGSIDLAALTTALTTALAQNSVKFDVNELSNAIKASLDFSPVIESISNLPLSAIQDSLQQLIEITQSVIVANQSPSTIQDQIKQLENAVQQDIERINILRGNEHINPSISRSHRPDFFGGDDDFKNTNDIQRQIEQLEKDRQQKIERLNYLKSLLQSKTTDTQINLADKFNFDSVDSNKLNELIQFLKTYVNLINKLANDKTMTRVTDNINSLTQAISKFGGSKRKENPILTQLENLMSKGNELQALSSILQKSVGEIQAAVEVVQNAGGSKDDKKNMLGHVDINTEEWDKLIEKAEKFGIALEDIDRITRHVDNQGRESFQFIDKLGNIKTFGIDSEEFKFIEENIVKVKDSISSMKKEADSLPNIFQKAFRGDANASTNIVDTLERINSLFAEISKYPNELTGDKSGLLTYVSNSIEHSIVDVNNLLTGSQKNKNPEFKNDLNEIINALKQVKELIDSGEFKEASGLLNNTTQDFFNLGTIANTQDIKNLSSAQKLLGNINQMLYSYRSMSREYKQDFKGLSRDIIDAMQQYNNAIPSDKMKEFNERFLEIRSNALKSLRTIGAHFKRSALQLARMYLSWYRIISYIRQGVQEVIEMDTALTKMSYTMNVTEDQLKSMSADMISMAKNLATSVSNVEQIYQIYANLKTTQEELEKTAMPTAILSNLASVDASTAADQIQGVLNQFELMADDTMHIVDVYDKISANIKVDYSKGIAGMADAVQQVGNFANQAGLSFEQLAAIVGRVMQQTRQEGGQIGTALKTIMTRVSKASNLADPEEVDNATLDKASKTLHRIGVEVYTASGEFREFDTIMTELSEKWDTLSDAEQANISFAIAATRQTFVSVYGNMHNRIYLIAGNA